MEEQNAKWCTECGTRLQMSVKFCPDCGHKVESVSPSVETATPLADVEEDEPVATDQPQEGADDSLPAKRRMSKPLIIGVVAVLGILVASAAVWGLTRSSIAETQYEVSAPVLMSTLDDMSGAQSSRTVRQVADSAGTELTTVNATLDTDPTASGADRLVTMRDAFASLAELHKYRVDNTDVWTDNRSDLLNNLDTLSTYGGTTETAAAAGDDTARNLDDMTHHINKAMSKWHKQVRKARAQARAERASVASYHSNMEYLIDQYTDLRNDTAAFNSRMRSEQMWIYEVTDYYTQAASDRRTILSQMTQLSPPGQMSSEHSQIVAVLGQAADAIDAAVSAIEDRECFDGECYFEFNTQWQQFQDESDVITTRYGNAYDAWQAEMARTERQTGKADLPDKPDL